MLSNITSVYCVFYRNLLRFSLLSFSKDIFSSDQLSTYFIKPIYNSITVDKLKEELHRFWSYAWFVQCFPAIYISLLVIILVILPYWLRIVLYNPSIMQHFWALNPIGRIWFLYLSSNLYAVGKSVWSDLDPRRNFLFQSSLG